VSSGTLAMGLMRNDRARANLLAVVAGFLSPARASKSGHILDAMRQSPTSAIP
jgi:hypothetical protein